MSKFHISVSMAEFGASRRNSCARSKGVVASSPLCVKAIRPALTYNSALTVDCRCCCPKEIRLSLKESRKPSQRGECRQVQQQHDWTEEGRNQRPGKFRHRRRRCQEACAAGEQ